TRPSDAAAMPFPRELTTPPVTKMYFVELTDSPPAVGRSVGRSGPPPRSADPRLCLRPAPPAPGTAPRRSRRRGTAGAAAPAAPNAPPGRARAAPTGQA